LLQPGKTDAGALFTSNISQSAFAPRGTATVLQKGTIIVATLFMLSALLLSMPVLQGNVSVLSSNPEASSETPAVTNSNAEVNANTNSAVSTSANTNAAQTNTANSNQ
jgi:preprotein translocase subunit SecG